MGNLDFAPLFEVFGPFRNLCLHLRVLGDHLPADAGPFPFQGDTSGPLLQGGLGLRLCWYSFRIYVDTPGAGRAGPGGVGGTTSGVVAPGVEHAGDSVRLSGP